MPRANGARVAGRVACASGGKRAAVCASSSESLRPYFVGLCLGSDDDDDDDDDRERFSHLTRGEFHSRPSRAASIALCRADAAHPESPDAQATSRSGVVRRRCDETKERRAKKRTRKTKGDAFLLRFSGGGGCAVNTRAAHCAETTC
mgnify:CR=1 FL=1